MKTSDFDYDLPDALIAQHPTEKRTESRLLLLEDDGVRDRCFTDFVEVLREDDLLVLNDTRVIPARLALKKPTGGGVEVMLERFTDPRALLALARSNKPLKEGEYLYLGDQAVLQFVARESGFFRFRVPDDVDGEALFYQHGQMPLPPYIRRRAAAGDAKRYQTVYAQAAGAVAAPTAGLHFDKPTLAGIRKLGVEVVAVTLHVGAGTFQPVKAEDASAHRMHRERYVIDAPTARSINAAKAVGRRVVAVGTTTVRALESAALRSVEAGGATLIGPVSADTNLFITPGFDFRVVDAMLTNFNLPRSTLLMMISAFAGRDRVLSAYRHAVEMQYRFFSYGDAMWLTRRKCSDEV